ncbi:MAG: redoxin domain-containing protein, partial [Phaeodactylibacter sp.]|nr:redoxin domain-containing protein [Phaeodactylibacter sp.]
TIKGSIDNQIFYEYLDFLGVKRPEADKLRQDIEAAADKPNKQEKLQAELDALNKEVEAYQLNLIAAHPKTMTAAVIKANLAMPNMPEFTGTDEEIRFQQWQFTREHFFDNLDMGDPKMLRTPFLYQRINNYIQNLTSAHPDSINVSLDQVLEAMRPAPETFKYYLVHFLNEYAKSKVVGYDAMYVHLVDTYYATGQAPWTEEEQLGKILDNAQRLKPLLIGKIAPNIKMQTQDGKEIWLHDFESPITVLFFWDPECGHCKKSMPEMVEFYNAYKDKGVEIFAVCTKLYNELDSCWKFIDEKGIGIWLNTVDPYHRSKYKTVYDIRSTPQIYVLDHKKEILSKRIGAEQLPEVLDRILEIMKKEEN